MRLVEFTMKRYSRNNTIFINPDHVVAIEETEKPDQTCIVYDYIDESEIVIGNVRDVAKALMGKSSEEAPS